MSLTYAQISWFQDDYGWPAAVPQIAHAYTLPGSSGTFCGGMCHIFLLASLPQIQALPPVPHSV